MKAIVYNKYGNPDVLQIKDIEKPIPKKNHVLIRIEATTVTPSDLMIRSGKYPLLFWLPVRIKYGIINPRSIIPGYELSGVIESVGEDVKLFKMGDEVFGATMGRMSCCAEYISLPEGCALAIKPENMTYEEAATVTDAGCTALHFLRKGNIQKGQKVLIYGASGSIGTIAVQLAKYFGSEVTGICSTTNIELVKVLGADKLIDYTKEDFTKNGEAYDIIFDTVGKSPFSQCKGSLKKKGVYLSTVMKPTSYIRGKWTSITSSKKAIGGFSMSKAKELYILKDLVEKGKIKAVIDRQYPLEQIIEAHRYVEQGHKKGNVVITVNNPE